MTSPDSGTGAPAADQYGLGRHVLTCAGGSRTLVIGLAVAFMLLGLGAALNFGADPILAIRKEPADPASVTALYVLCRGGGAVLVAGGLAFAWVAVRRARNRILVFADGLVWREGGAEHVWRWEDIVEVVRDQKGVDGKGAIHSSLRIKALDGRSVTAGDSVFEMPGVLCSGPEFSELLRTVEDETTRRRLPAALASFKAGRPAEFGGLRLDAAGIQWSGARIGWAEIWSVDPRVEHTLGRLRWALTTRAGGRIELPVGKVPDLALACAMIAELRRQLREEADVSQADRAPRSDKNPSSREGL